MGGRAKRPATPPPAAPARTFTGAALVHPLRREVRSRAYTQGATVAEVAADLLPDRHGDRLLACALNNVPVPRELWPRVRPKPGTLCQLDTSKNRLPVSLSP